MRVRCGRGGGVGEGKCWGGGAIVKRQREERRRQGGESGSCEKGGCGREWMSEDKQGRGERGGRYTGCTAKKMEGYWRSTVENGGGRGFIGRLSRDSKADYAVAVTEMRLQLLLLLVFIIVGCLFVCV